MFELQSCKITGREKRGDASNMFTVHIASYESTFVDENKYEYVYPRELIYIGKVPSLADCLNDTISVFYNKEEPIPMYINGTFYKRHICLDEVNCVCSFLKRNGLFVYDVTQSLTAPSEYNLLVEKECTTTC